MKHTILLSGALCLFSFSAQADVIDTAYRACAAFEATGMTSDCKVSGFGHSIDVSMDTNGTEANAICRQSAQAMRASGFQFDKGWKLKIYSPFSNGNILASCGL